MARRAWKWVGLGGGAVAAAAISAGRLRPWLHRPGVLKRERAARARSDALAGISGEVRPGFEAVRDAFAGNFARGRELGAACAVYYRGEKVVDLWGGLRDEGTGARWEEDTMCIVYSATKGMSGMCIALAHSRGLFDFDERVATYWPEFAQNGKERITVRQLLAHQAGLFELDERIDQALVRDPDRLAQVLARQKPAWPPGTRQGYHGITIGFYESELLRRVDPQHRTIGRFFQEELATPLGLDFYIRVPESVPDRRLAKMKRSSQVDALIGLPPSTFLAAFNPRSRLRRCLLGSELSEQTDRVYAREQEIPAGGGVGTARAMARAYGVFATGGRELGLNEDTLRELMAPPRPPTRGFRDACLKADVRFSVGFGKPNPKHPFAHATAFGFPGAGGSYGFADPESQLGFAYVPNRMGGALEDPRAFRLSAAVYRSLGETDPKLTGG